MKKIALGVMMLCVGIAQAGQVYKCPGKVEGKYVYQERPCPGAKADEHTLKVMPSNEKKISEAQNKLAKELEEAKNKEAQEKATEGAVPQPSASPLPTSPQPTPLPPANADSAMPYTTAPTPVPPTTTPKASTVIPAPVVPGTNSPQNLVQPKSGT